MKILGIAGSLRAGSYNKKMIRAAGCLAPQGMHIELFDIGAIPLYNADIDTDELRPQEVRNLKDVISHADGILFSTPEYNHSVPGVLQNAIDWASRPAMNSVLRDKPVAIIGVSMGAIGAARAQQVLKTVLMGTLSHVFPHAGVSVGTVQNKFDNAGELIDDVTREFLETYLKQFGEYVARFAPPQRNRSAA